MATTPEYFDRYPLIRPRITKWNRTEKDLYDFLHPNVGLLLPQPTGGYLYEDENGTFNPRGNLERLFSKELNFSYWEKGQVDCVLEGMPRRVLLGLDINGETTLPNGLSLLWPSSSNSLVLGRNKYLINLKNLVHPSWKPKDLDTLSEVVKKNDITQKLFCRINPYSSASTVGDFLVLHNPQEFYWTERFNDKENRYILKDYHQAYKAQLEYSQMGFLRNVVNYDQPKAHLKALMELPSMERDNIVRVYEETTRKENAHPGSLVRIETTIPLGFSFGPIPYKGKWPIGYIPLSDPFPIIYLDILETLGIPYTIKWSYQVLLKDTERRPWKDLGSYVWAMEEKLAPLIYPLREKVFHWTLAGHMMTTYYEKTEEWEVKAIKTTIDYNPIMALGILGIVHKKTYLAGFPDCIAKRVDEITTRGENGLPGFLIKTKGDMVVLKENMRDLPGEDILRKTIEPFKDFHSFPLKKTTYRGLRNVKGKGPLGSSYMDMKVIYPGPYNRILKGGEGRRVGDYLAGEVESLPPTIIEGELQYFSSPPIVNADWLDSWKEQENG